MHNSSRAAWGRHGGRTRCLLAGAIADQRNIYFELHQTAVTQDDLGITPDAIGLSGAPSYPASGEIHIRDVSIAPDRRLPIS